MFIELWSGLLGTLSLAGGAWLMALPTGIFLGFGATRNLLLRDLIKIGSIFFTAVPFIAILFWMHYPLQDIVGVLWDPFLSTFILLSLFLIFNVADVLTDTILFLKEEYNEQALMLGVSQWTLVWKVLFPSSLQVIMPRLLSLAVLSIHITMFASLIGVNELFKATQRLNSKVLKPVELFTFMAFLYAVVCIPLYVFSEQVKKYGQRIKS